MEDKYIIVTWPESQNFIGRDGCHLINDDLGYVRYGSSAYFVREDVYERVMHNLQSNKDDLPLWNNGEFYKD